jgi:PAS domain S-box-containing protein
MFNESGEAVKLTGTIQDVTERRRAEEELREWASFAELNPAPVLRFDPDGKVTHANPAAHQIFGKDKLERKFIGEIIAPISNINIGELVRDGQVNICDITVGERSFQFVVRGVSDLGVGHVYGSEITKRKRSEETLHSLKEFNENVVQSIQDGLITLDKDFRITSWNKAMEEISGYAAQEMLGKVPFKVFPHLIEEGVDELHRAALEGQAIERTNIPYQTPKGKIGYTDERYLPLRDQAGEIIGTLAVVEDVTEMVRLEQRVAGLQEELEQRKLVEIAKGILMRELGLSEAESYKLIQKRSRDRNEKMREIARLVIELHGTKEERDKFA